MFYVTASIILTPRLGAATIIGFIIAGRVVMSVVLHRFGLLNLPVQPVILPKLVGAVLVIVGAALVLRSSNYDILADEICPFLYAPKVLQWGSGSALQARSGGSLKQRRV